MYLFILFIYLPIKFLLTTAVVIWNGTSKTDMIKLILSAMWKWK